MSTKEIEICLGVTQDDRYAAATGASPYFFFLGDTEEEVTATAKRAIQFYAGDGANVRTGDKKILRTTPLKSISSKTFADVA